MIFKTLTFFILTLFVLSSCNKASVKPISKSPDTTKSNPSTPPKDTTTTSLPTGVGTSFGQSSSSWIIGMQSNSQGPIQYAGDYTNKIAVDASGNIFILSDFIGVVDLDPSSNVVLGGSTARNMVTLLKYNASGSLLWAKPFNTSGMTDGVKIISDASNNVYCLISSTSVPNLQLGASNYTPHNSASYEIIKFSNDGNLIWVSEVNSQIFDMAIDPLNNVYIVGSTLNDAEFYSAAGENTLNPLSAGGATLFWAKFSTSGKYAASSDIVPAGYVNPVITTDANQNVYIIGGTVLYGNYTPAFPLITGDNVTEGGSFIAKYSAGNSPVWFRGFHGSNSIADMSRLAAVTTDQNSNLLIFAANSTSDDLFKMDSTGNLQWTQGIANNLNSGYLTMLVNNSGQVFISGDIIPQLNSAQFPAIFYNKYNSDGSVVYTKSLQGYDINAYLGLYDAAIDKNGNIDMVGYFTESVDLLGATGDPRHSSSDLYNSFFIAHFPD